MKAMAFQPPGAERHKGSTKIGSGAKTRGLGGLLKNRAFADPAPDRPNKHGPGSRLKRGAIMAELRHIMKSLTGLLKSGNPNGR